MSDKTRIENEIRDKRAIIDGLQRSIESDLRKANEAHRRIGRSPDASRSYQWDSEQKAKAKDAENSANSHRRTIDQLQNKIRGLESYLRR